MDYIEKEMQATFPICMLIKGNFKTNLLAAHFNILIYRLS